MTLISEEKTVQLGMWGERERKKINSQGQGVKEKEAEAEMHTEVRKKREEKEKGGCLPTRWCCWKRTEKGSTCRTQGGGMCSQPCGTSGPHLPWVSPEEARGDCGSS